MTKPISSQLCTALVFAARYAHGRNTGAAFAVVTALKQCWHLLDANTRHQIIRESHEAEYSESQYNRDDWQDLRDFAEEFNQKEQP